MVQVEAPEAAPAPDEGLVEEMARWLWKDQTGESWFRAGWAVHNYRTGARRLLADLKLERRT